MIPYFKERASERHVLHLESITKAEVTKLANKLVLKSELSQFLRLNKDVKTLFAFSTTFKQDP